MSKLKIGLTLLFSALGVFGVNEYYKPRNVRDLLKWQGVQLSSDSKVWKSMFFEHSEELKAKNIKDDDGLWKWCEERFNSSNLGDTQIIEEARKFCSDNPTSIMARIIREGEEDILIGQSDIKAFQINYILAGGSEEVLKPLGLSEKHSSTTKEVAGAISKWCEDQKKSKVATQEDLQKYTIFKKRCYNYNKGVSTLGDLLRKQGRAPIRDNEFEERYKKLQYSPSLKEEMQKIKEEMDKSLSKFEGLKDKELREQPWRQYQWWCKKKLTSQLIEEGIYQNSFAAVKERCTEEKIVG